MDDVSLDGNSGNIGGDNEFVLVGEFWEFFGDGVEVVLNNWVFIGIVILDFSNGNIIGRNLVL